MIYYCFGTKLKKSFERITGFSGNEITIIPSVKFTPFVMCNATFL